MSVCSLCGAPFSCAPADGVDGPCWCAELPPVMAVPALGADTCWCPACLKAALAERAQVGLARGAELAAALTLHAPPAQTPSIPAAGEHE